MKSKSIFNRVTAIVMGGCMLLSLAGCSANGANNSGNKGGQDSIVQTDESAKESGNEGAITEITFWHSMDTSFGETLDKQIQNFNNTVGAEKNIKVSSVFQSYPGTEALNAAMSSDDIANMPDVIQLYGESVSLVRDYERTVWAEDKITSPDASLNKEDLIPNALASFTIDDKLIGVPYNMACYLLYYNETQLKEAGFIEPPKTIAEMAEMLPVLVEKTEADYGLNVRINMNEMINFIESQGSTGAFFGNNKNGHDGHMTELQCIEDGTLKNFINEWGKVIDSNAYKAVRDSINEEFAAEMHSMVIMSSSRVQIINDLVQDSFEWGIAAVPTVNENDCGGSFPTGSGLFMLDRDDPVKTDAAWEFVQYMASPEIQAEWLETTGYVPTNIKALDTDIYKDSVAQNPKLAIPYEVLSASPADMTCPFTPNYSAVDTLIKDTMISFANKEMNADEVYEALVDGSKKIFDEYYRSNPIEQIDLMN